MNQLFKFAVVGAIGFVVDTAVLYLMLYLSATPMAGRAVSFLCAAYTTWQINRRITFTPNALDSAWKEWTRYLLAMLGGGAVNLLAYHGVMTALPDSWFKPAFAVAVGSVAGLFVNFLSAKLIVYR